MEENKNEVIYGAPKKSNGGLVVVIVLLLLIVLGLGGFIFVNKDKLFNSNKTTDSGNEEVVEKGKNLKLDTATKTKLERFVKAGTFTNPGGTNTIDYFKDGVTSITKMMKLKMAFINSYLIDKKGQRGVTLTEEERNAISGIKPDANETVSVLDKKDLDNEYKTLFGENPEYTYEEISGFKTLGCPAPLGWDATTGKLYLYSRCGGTSAHEYSSEITSYDSDTDYYYVHQVSKYVNSEETIEYKLVWKFDKDLKFVSTEKE